MSNSLEERLKTHSSAFDGLLSLIPAKYYYDNATQDQWQQRKKSKQELKQNKKLKLDPDSRNNANEYSNSHASAKDVMVNKAKHAKNVNLPTKNSALLNPSVKISSEEVENGENVDKSEDEEVEENEVDISDSDSSMESHSDHENSKENISFEDINEEDFMNNENNLIFDDEGNEIENDEMLYQKQINQKLGNQKKQPSPEEEQKRKENLAKLREKLESRINNLREKRKAIGSKVTGAPKSREQILNERKKREELKKQQKRKHEELEDEESVSEDDDEEDDDEAEEIKDENMLFGNIVFQDGSQMTSDLSKLRNSSDKKKLKGPANKDIKAHLMILEKKKQKLSALTPEEKNSQLEKDKWQNVMAQAEGIKLKNDEKLLKKSLKRKEKQKLKSEIEWRERKQFVKDSVSARAKKREENLKARKDGKGLSKKAKKHQPKLKKFTGLVNNSKNKGKSNNNSSNNNNNKSTFQNKRKRAGFEGSAKSKAKK